MAQEADEDEGHTASLQLENTVRQMFFQELDLLRDAGQDDIAEDVDNEEGFLSFRLGALDRFFKQPERQGQPNIYYIGYQASRAPPAGAGKHKMKGGAEIPQYIQDAFHRAQAENGGMVHLELPPFAQGFRDALAGRANLHNHPSYEVGYYEGTQYNRQPANAQPANAQPRREEPRREDPPAGQPSNAGRGRPIRFGFLQQLPSRLE
jgi:hypothetical protein